MWSPLLNNYLNLNGHIFLSCHRKYHMNWTSLRITFSLFQRWPLNKGLSVYNFIVRDPKNKLDLTSSQFIDAPQYCWSTANVGVKHQSIKSIYRLSICYTNFMQMLFLSSYVCYIIEINTSVMKNCQRATFNLVVIEKQEAHSNFKDWSFFY